MTRRNSKQQPLFPVRMFLPEPFERGSFYDVVSRFGGVVIRRSDFDIGDPEHGGTNGHCPVRLSALVLLQSHHGWDDRETVRRAQVDMQVKACLGMGLEERGPSQPTLCRHRQEMKEKGLADAYMARFRDLVEALELVGDEEPVLIDSVPIHGAGQQLDTYNLIAGATRRGLRELARVEGKDIKEVATSLGLAAYLDRSIKGRFEVDWSSEESQRQFLAQLVDDASTVRKALASKTEADERGDDEDSEPPDEMSGAREAMATIDDVIEHDVERDDDGKVKGIRQKAAGDRRMSVTDPDMRHGRKSASNLFAGFKAQVVTSLVFNFIVFFRVMKANVHDGENLPELVEELKQQGITPAWWAGDHAYGTLKNHRFFNEHVEGELVARMARPVNGGRFTKDDFKYDFEAQTLTCPAGHKLPHQKWDTERGRKGHRFDFTHAGCATCPRRGECVSPKAAEDQGRTVFIVDDEERLIRNHLRRREESEFKERLSKRPAVERAIAGFAQCGGKQARRFGMENVEFDGKLSALTYNLRRLGSLMRADDTLEERLVRAWRASARLLAAWWYSLGYFWRPQLA
jgi:hypothetical protein